MLTFDQAKETFRYDPETGKVYWKIDVGIIKAGTEAGSLGHRKRNTYKQIQFRGKDYLAHRVAWLLHYGVWPENKIDHCDGDGLNNRPGNMKDATNQENQRNSRMYQTNTSGFPGVSRERGKWRAVIYINGRQKYLGCFDDKDKAATAYRKAANELRFTERHGVAE